MTETQGEYNIRQDVDDANEMIGVGYDYQQHITDNSDLRKYRIELPNLYDDSVLDPYEFRLLAHYKRVGICTESTKTTAKKTRMSPAQVSIKRRSLAEKDFIELTEVPINDKEFSYSIAVVDIWKENFDTYSPHKQTHSPHKQTVYQVKQRKNHIKKEPVKNKEGASAKPKATDFPSNVLYREVTEYYPPKATWHRVLQFMNEIQTRLGRTPTKEDLFPFYEAWCARGWLTTSINWLEYAARGTMPTANTNGANHDNRKSNAERNRTASERVAGRLFGRG